MTLQYSRDILRIMSKQKFVECSSNILETLLCDYWNLPKVQHLLSSHHTLLTQKQLFHREFVKKIFSFKMFPKCSLDTWNIATLREHSASIPGIFRAGWVGGSNFADFVRFRPNTCARNQRFLPPLMGGK